MSANNRFSRLFAKGKLDKIEVRLDMIDFQDNGIFHTYAPALDLVGYGNTQEEARNSFDTILQEYINYTIHKGTLLSDLEKHGWQVSKKHLDPPSFTWLIQHNQQAKDVFDSHNFSKRTNPVRVPLVADCP